MDVKLETVLKTVKKEKLCGIRISELSMTDQNMFKKKGFVVYNSIFNFTNKIMRDGFVYVTLPGVNLKHCRYSRDWKTI